MAPANFQEPTMVGVLALLASNLGIWAREYYKRRTFQRNGRRFKELSDKVGQLEDKIDTVAKKDDVKEIDGKIDSLGSSMTEARTEIRSMKANCASTVVRFDEEIRQSRKDMLEHVRENHK